MARPRSTIAHKLAAGTLRRDRLRGYIVPSLSALPPPAESLGPTGRAAWEKFGRQALELGTLTRFDVGVLELLAQAWESCHELSEMLARDGLVMTSVGSTKKAHPGLAALDRSRSLVRRLLTDLGLNPAARQFMVIETPDPQPTPQKRAATARLARRYFEND